MSNPLAMMLDELMGRDRDLAPSEKRSEIKWDDPDVMATVFMSILTVFLSASVKNIVRSRKYVTNACNSMRSCIYKSKSRGELHMASASL